MVPKETSSLMPLKAKKPFSDMFLRNSLRFDGSLACFSPVGEARAH